MKSKQKQTPTEIIENQRQAVVEKIIEDMKRDGLRWAEPYLPSLTPHNPVSGTVYQGGNRVHLGFIGFMRGYTDNRWATFNQIKDAGWHVKKGAKSALIEKWKQFAFYKENEDTGEKELAGRYPKLVGYWNVFNAEDIEGIPPENAPVHLNDRTATIAQNLEESSRCPVIESSGYLGSAAYSPATDRILIAPRETFRSDEAFTRVLLHEMTHSTGHPSAPTPARSFTSTWERLRSVRITAPSGRMLGAVPGRLSASSWSATDSSTPSFPGMSRKR